MEIPWFLFWKKKMIRRANILLYLIELINCYAAVYYSNFLFFYLRRTFGFSEAENLMTAALGGFVYMIAAWQGGKLSQRYGYVRMIYTGCGIIIASLALGMILSAAASQILVYCLCIAGVCLIWPALEALICIGAGASLGKTVGLYNVTWALGGALAYFTTGLLLEQLGMASLFWLPLGLTAAEVILLPVAAKWQEKETVASRDEASSERTVPPANAKRFLQMAWLANPFAYVAINTVIPLVPSIAERLGLSTGMAGVICSAWMFARLGVFICLWRWTGWHYRFGWLAGSFLLMIICFFGFLTAQSVIWLLMAQVGFGVSIGLIYYSSLYYAMNVSENHGTNAGLHEAMIGAGLLAGPAAGAAALYLAPTAAGIGAWSVGGLLCAGFSGLIFLKYYRRQ